MSMTQTNNSVIGVVALFALLVGFAQAAERKPNILFILVDDYGIMDVGIEGSRFNRFWFLEGIVYVNIRADQLSNLFHFPVHPVTELTIHRQRLRKVEVAQGDKNLSIIFGDGG